MYKKKKSVIYTYKYNPCDVNRASVLRAGEHFYAIYHVWVEIILQLLGLRCASLIHKQLVKSKDGGMVLFGSNSDIYPK